VPTDSARLTKLQQDVDDLLAGLYRTPNGPATIRGKQIRPKSISAGHIAVSDLESVNAKTGDLSVTGSIKMTAAGSFSAGQTAYNTGVGWWLDDSGATPRFSLGNSGGSRITWDGSTLNIVGTLTATSGSIGGWTIGATDLTGSGGVIGLASSGSIRIWSGNATPSSAPFQVDSLGNLTATAGAIGGWGIDSTSGLKLGSGASTRGIATGATAFYAGSATPSSAPFNVTTAGAVSCSNLTVTGGSLKADTINTGTLAFASGGTMNGASVTGTLGNTGGTLNLGKLTVAGQITLGSGGSIIDADGSTWDQNGLILAATGSLGDVITFNRAGFSPFGNIQSTFATNLGQMRMSTTATSSRSAALSLSATAADGTTNAGLTTAKSGGGTGAEVTAYADGNIEAHLGDAAGVNRFKILDSSVEVFGITSDGELVRPITNDATALGAYHGRIPIYINGSLKYIPAYDA
jgi:hypothetical protein